LPRHHLSETLGKAVDKPFAHLYGDFAELCFHCRSKSFYTFGLVLFNPTGDVAPKVLHDVEVWTLRWPLVFPQNCT